MSVTRTPVDVGSVAVDVGGVAVDRRLALRPDEAFAMLGVSRTHGWALIRAGTIPSIRLGARRLVPVKALENWLEEERQRQSA